MLVDFWYEGFLGLYQLVDLAVLLDGWEFDQEAGGGFAGWSVTIAGGWAWLIAASGLRWWRLLMRAVLVVSPLLLRSLPLIPIPSILWPSIILRNPLGLAQINPQLLESLLFTAWHVLVLVVSGVASLILFEFLKIREKGTFGLVGGLESTCLRTADIACWKSGRWVFCYIVYSDVYVCVYKTILSFKRNLNFSCLLSGSYVQ